VRRPADRPASGLQTGAGRPLSALAALVLLALLAPLTASAEAAPAPSAGLSSMEARGKQLYLTGESPSAEPVTALMGDAGIEVPATALPCSSCHGRDGRGRPEGGVVPSDLTWDALTRPYVVTTATGRERGPYTERSVQRAVLLGIDSSGSDLDSLMPRYRLSREDADALVAYLKVLGKDRDPGVEDESLTLGVLLPPAEATELAVTARSVRKVVDAYVGRVNDGGGVYHRALRVRYLPVPAAVGERPAAVGAFLDAETIFALVASFTAGADRELADLAEERGVPLVGPLTLHPDESFPLNRQVFYLDGGLSGRARALVRAAGQRARETAAGPRSDGNDPTEDGSDGVAAQAGAGARTAAIVFADEPRMAAVAEAAADAIDQAGDRFAAVERLGYPPGGFDAAAAVARLRALGADDVFLLTPGPVEAELLDAAAAAGWSPHVYALGSLVGGELFTPRPGFHGRLDLALGSLPLDRTPPGLSRFHDALGDPSITAGTTEIAAFTAIDLLVDGLERTGRDISREGLIEALEVLRDRPTGLTRPLSFGPNRRVGVRGAYVVRLDPAHPQAPTEVVWVEP